MFNNIQLPEGWVLKRLAETASTGPNSFIDGDWIEEEYMDSEGIRVIQTGNIGIGKFIDRPDFRKFISDRSFSELNCKWVHPGDLLIYRLGDPVGRCCKVPDDIGECVTAVDCTIYRPSPSEVDSSYIVHALNFDAHLKQVSRFSSGTTRTRISRTNLGKIPIHLPSEPEQRRIAFVLDTIDEAIAKTEAVIAKLKQVRAGLLHDLLTRGLDENGELRDPIAHPEQFKDSSVGTIPKEWEVDSLGNLAIDGLSNGFFKKPSLVGSGYRLVNVFDLYQPFGINLELVERVRATEIEWKRFEVKKGDIFFTRSSLVLSGIAHCNILRNLTEPALFESHVMKLTPNRTRMVPEFLAHWCRSAYARSFFMSRARQVTMVTISQPDILPLLIPVPPRNEQERIIEFIDASDDSIRIEETNCDKLKLMKSGLMSDLLTGSVRVPEEMGNQINSPKV